MDSKLNHYILLNGNSRQSSYRTTHSHEYEFVVGLKYIPQMNFPIKIDVYGIGIVSVKKSF